MEPNRQEERIGLVLEGRVQGVGFRWWTVRAARRHAIRGTVRNRPDGSVELHAAGPAGRLRPFLEEVRQGPPSSAIAHERRIETKSDLPPDFRVVS
jgi:acylphosphatase